MAYSYARRQELARAQGFASYYDKRQVVSFANKSDDFARLVGPAGGQRAQNLDMAKLHYQAFGPKADPKDYSIHTRRGKPVVTPGGKGAKAKWLIDVARYVDDTDEWRRRYPSGQRG